LKIAILNGPNLNRLGIRKPEIYGTKTMAQILIEIQQKWPDVHFVYRQTNHEGDLIDFIQELTSEQMNELADERVAGIVLNAGGYSHTSVALRDAVEESEVPIVEVHISDIRQREPFRRVSLLTDVCAHSIIGHGIEGYSEAVEWIINRY
jgi:3-dehydroquinate dehydratase-2